LFQIYDYWYELITVFPLYVCVSVCVRARARACVCVYYVLSKVH